MTTLRIRGVILRLALLVAIAAGLVLTSSGRAQGPALPPELETLRAALDKYRDPYVAVRDGYFSTVGCVHYPQPGGAGRVPYPAGGMGIHFLNPKLVGPVPDPMRPPILVYEPDGDALRLVAAEWIVPLTTGITERPTVFGRPFDGPMEGHEPLMPRALHHYDLHVWLWKENPAGLFSPTNPRVTCAGSRHALAEEPPAVVVHSGH